MQSSNSFVDLAALSWEIWPLTLKPKSGLTLIAKVRSWR